MYPIQRYSPTPLPPVIRLLYDLLRLQNFNDDPRLRNVLSSHVSAESAHEVSNGRFQCSDHTWNDPGYM
jgi:hypothetical protein